MARRSEDRDKDYVARYGHASGYPPGNWEVGKTALCLPTRHRFYSKDCRQGSSYADREPANASAK